MIAVPQATAALYIQNLLLLIDIYQFSKFIQNIRILENFGKFLLIVGYTVNHPTTLHTHNETQLPTAACQWNFALWDVSII